MEAFDIKTDISPLPINDPKANFNLSVDYVNGLIDGDGSFGISFGIKKSNVTPFFTISADICDLELLYNQFFGTGIITKSTSRKYAQFRIQNRKCILEHVIPLLKSMHRPGR